MEYKERKSPRLKTFDYNMPGVYFVTFCTYKMRMLFWENPLHSEAFSGDERLNFAGQIADEVINELPQTFPIEIKKYVIMPNHIHMMVLIKEKSSGTGANSMLCRIISYAKRKITLKLREKKVDETIWNRSYYDHIVRNEKDYQRIWKYIENNPNEWKKDRFFEVGDDHLL